jgi:hypothetical protein
MTEFSMRTFFALHSVSACLVFQAAWETRKVGVRHVKTVAAEISASSNTLRWRQHTC